MKNATGIVCILTAFLMACGGSSSGPSSPSGQSPTQISVAISPSAQQSIDAGQSVNFTATVSNDTSGQGVTWALSGSGCTGSACGALTSTSKSAATYTAPSGVSSSLTVTVTATSAANNVASASAMVKVNPTPVIIAASLQVGAVGSPYSAALQASGGTPPLSWSVTSGSLPSGLALSASTGIISGTPTTTGVSNFTVQVSDSAPTSQSATQQFSITIVDHLVITTNSLPSGLVDTAYSATLQATGGTAPYSWSIASGSLPPGLTLNAGTGVISGTPSTAGTYSFTAEVSDSTSPTPQAATAQFSITVANRLVVLNTSLPQGSVNTAYSAQLQASGGVTPYAWSISSGSLPAGLSLNAGTGVISGTPTASGVFNFTVQVTDSSASTPQTATQQLSITITGNLVIATTSLPDGTVGVAYTATLEADYATLPVTWSIISGTLPGGLALDPATGVISGTPSVQGSFSFTVMVKDSSTPTAQTATQSLSITVNASGVNDTELSGRYAFLLSGYDGNGNRVAVAGSLVADGSGSITSGVEDINSAASTPQTGLAFTGNYSVGSDNRGTITITNSAGATYTMVIALGSLNGGTATGGSILEFDSTGYIISGVIELQNSAAFLKAAISGPYVFGFEGSDRAGSRMGVIGQFNADGAGGISSGVFDADDSGTPTTSSPIANTSAYSVNTTTGRGTVSLSGVTPADYSFYIVSGSRLLAISTDSATTAGVVAGEIDAQTGGPFSNGSLNASVVMSLESAAALSGGGSCVMLGTISFDGNGNGSFSADENDAGSITSVAGNGTYTAPDAATGRFTLAPPQGIPMLVGYLAAPNQGFLIGTDNKVTMGELLAQSGGPFTNASLNTSVFFGTQAFAVPPVPPPAGGPSATLSTGIFVFDGSGNISVTSDEDELGTLLSDQTSTDNYSTSSSGRVTFGSNSMILYMVSPTHVATMSTRASDPNPVLGFGQN